MKQLGLEFGKSDPKTFRYTLTLCHFETNITFLLQVLQKE